MWETQQLVTVWVGATHALSFVVVRVWGDTDTEQLVTVCVGGCDARVVFFVTHRSTSTRSTRPLQEQTVALASSFPSCSR